VPGYAWPPALRTGSFAAMLNFEIGDHPIYDGLELQWFDDVAHVASGEEREHARPYGR
jgi:hypothetical protein